MVLVLKGDDVLGRTREEEMKKRKQLTGN